MVYRLIENLPPKEQRKKLLSYITKHGIGRIDNLWIVRSDINLHDRSVVLNHGHINIHDAEDRTPRAARYRVDFQIGLARRPPGTLHESLSGTVDNLEKTEAAELMLLMISNWVDSGGCADPYKLDRIRKHLLYWPPTRDVVFYAVIGGILYETPDFRKRGLRVIPTRTTRRH